MKALKFLLLLCIVSCGKQRIVELPEIENAKITEVLDVSPAYIFYEEEGDSATFNRKNLIGTTNWLVNVDKRLNMAQVLPHLQYLQNKRSKKGMHTNEAAKNYFTCNDITRNNLGFIDFTKVSYESISHDSIQYISTPVDKPFIRNDSGNAAIARVPLIINSYNDIKVGTKRMDIKALSDHINTLANDSLGIAIQIYYSKALNFQDYISTKEIVDALISDNISINNEEIFF